MRIWKVLWDLEWGLAAVGAGLCLMAMMLITVASVFGRYILMVDLIPGAYNIIERIIFPLLVFWALPVAHRDQMFPKLDTIPHLLSPIWRAVVAVFVLVVEVGIYAFVLWLVTKFVWVSYLNQRTMQVGTEVWVLWPILVWIPLAFLLMITEMLRLIYHDFLAVLGRGKMPEEPESPVSGTV
jgi:TRAP-type C4-dicarboxylate transport system permease small subunit